MNPANNPQRPYIRAGSSAKEMLKEFMHAF
jgi:hypothetical protein